MKWKTHWRGFLADVTYGRLLLFLVFLDNFFINENPVYQWPSFLRKILAINIRNAPMHQTRNNGKMRWITRLIEIDAEWRWFSMILYLANRHPTHIRPAPLIFAVIAITPYGYWTDSYTMPAMTNRWKINSKHLRCHCITVLPFLSLLLIILWYLWLTDILINYVYSYLQVPPFALPE